MSRVYINRLEQLKRLAHNHNNQYLPSGDKQITAQDDNSQSVITTLIKALEKTGFNITAAALVDTRFYDFRPSV